MKVHKTTLIISITFLIYTNYVSANIVDTITKAPTLVKDVGTSTANALGSVGSSITSILISKEKKHVGSRIGFKHYGFLNSYKKRHKKKIEAKIIRSQKELNRFIHNADIKNTTSKDVDFSKDIILALEIQDPKTWALQIQALYIGDFFSFEIASKHTSSTCETSHIESITHLIQIEQPQIEDFDYKKFETIRHTSEIECPGQNDTINSQPLRHKTILYSQESINPNKNENLNVISHQWGEWAIFKQRHCPECPDISAPGLPKTGTVISLMDKKSGKQDIGHAKVIVHELYATPKKWVVQAERVVDLCHLGQRNTPLLAFVTPPRAHLKSARFQSGYIPESQIACHKQKTAEN